MKATAKNKKQVEKPAFLSVESPFLLNCGHFSYWLNKKTFACDGCLKTSEIQKTKKEKTLQRTKFVIGAWVLKTISKEEEELKELLSISKKKLDDVKKKTLEYLQKNKNLNEEIELYRKKQ